MAKIEQKMANLQKMISEIEKKVERLESQKKVLELSLDNYRTKLNSGLKEENEEI